jgi:hypothetical protein
VGKISFSAACCRTLPHVLLSRLFSNTSEYFPQQPLFKYLKMPCTTVLKYLQMSWSVACSRTFRNALLSSLCSNTSKCIPQHSLLEHLQSVCALLWGSETMDIDR